MILLSIKERSSSIFSDTMPCNNWSPLSYHAGEKGRWICGGFGFGGGVVATLINPWPLVWPWGVCWLLGGLPREEGVWGLGTATLNGPVTDRFVAINGGLCASDRLSDRREIPPSESLDPSDNLDIPSGSECCTCGWWSRPSWGCNLGGGRPSGSGSLKRTEKYKIKNEISWECSLSSRFVLRIFWIICNFIRGGRTFNSYIYFISEKIFASDRRRNSYVLICTYT